jgi:AraC-like DNA-binding protein
LNIHLLKIPLTQEHSFSVRYDVVPHFYDKWHYHPEIELVYIIKGSGQLFIGDNVGHFESGDMLLLGSDLPHLWRSDEKFLKKGSSLKVEAVVIHFLPGCFGEHFFALPENQSIARLLEKAHQGIRIKAAARARVSDMMKKLLQARHAERIIGLMQILHTIAFSKDTKPVCSKGLLFEYSPMETERLNNIYQYILNNFSRQITLQQIAEVAHLSEQSFCRYFKSRVKKTFSEFLIEIRIGKACKLLAETNKSVAEICYDCGYNSFSNFNRHFKSITGKTPLEHRKHYMDRQEPVSG